MSARPTRILFVCLGNICRSPTAEAVFAHVVREANLEHAYVIDSAGTGGWHAGEAAHPPTRATARGRGIEITHRARQIRPSDLDEFDLVLAMDAKNLRDLEALATTPAQRAKLRTFRSYDPSAPDGAEVPDPYYTGEFELVFDLCERAARGLLASTRPS